MGEYLNPGPALFRRARNSQIYVDKTGLISRLNKVVNTEQEYVCVSRPRRFGKSMAANMVCAYYDRTVDAAMEFSGLAIADDPSFDTHRNSFDVVRINMQEFLSATHDIDRMIELLGRSVSWEISRSYPHVVFFDDTDVIRCMSDVFTQTNRQFVIVVDEWDCPMREMQNDHDAQSRYLDFLRAWLKDRSFVSLCYMTGILPIKKYGTHSALNMFSEFSMVEARQMAPFMGFTEEEVRALCETWGHDFEECRAWYDGYRLLASDNCSVEVYNPKSVVEAMLSGVFSSYWNQTETYEALKRYIDLDMDGLHGKVVKLVSGASVPVNVETYLNDMTSLASADDVLTLLIHLGYLGYDWVKAEAFVPNREVMGEFANSIERGDGWGEVSRAIQRSESLLNDLLRGDESAVALGVERAHEDASSIISYNDENALACTLRLAFFSAVRRWRIVREVPAGKGFADLVLIPLASVRGVPGVVIELKYGAAATVAVDQIRERGYARFFEGLLPGSEVILCGISYDPKRKEHTCKIERVRV